MRSRMPIVRNPQVWCTARLAVLSGKIPVWIVQMPGSDRTRPTPAAAFVLTTDAVPDRVHEAFEGQRPELLATNLSEEDEARLRETFGD